jgi:hypothetical protein
MNEENTTRALGKTCSALKEQLPMVLDEFAQMLIPQTCSQSLAWEILLHNVVLTPDVDLDRMRLWHHQKRIFDIHAPQSSRSCLCFALWVMASNINGSKLRMWVLLAGE